MNLQENLNKSNKKVKDSLAQKKSTFLNFFSAKEAPKNTEEMDEEDEEKLDSIEEDYMIAIEIVDEIVPLALEYYLNIVEEMLDENAIDFDENEFDGEVIDGEEVSGEEQASESQNKIDGKMDSDDGVDD